MRSDEGATAVLIAVVMAAMLGFGAIAVDVGSLYAERRQLQNGADAAALAVAPECAGGACDTGTGSGSAAGRYADLNANDAAATVTEVCGTGPGLSPCSPVSDIGPWDCRPLPSGALAGVPYAQVRTETRRADGSDLMPPLFARVLDAGYEGTTVRACARVSWGGAAAMASGIPLTISNCEFESLVGSPPTNFAPGPPYPPYPDASWEHVLYFHDTTEAAAGDCPAGPSGGDDPLSGGFGWLESTDCVAESTVSDWFDTSPGASPGNDCKANQLDDHIGKLVYIPIYDRTNGLNGSNGQYGMRGYAAFVLTGYNLGGSYKVPSIISGSPGVYPCANDPTTGSQRCISGFFTQDLTPTSGTIGGPLLGAPPVIQMSG